MENIELKDVGFWINQYASGYFGKKTISQSAELSFSDFEIQVKQEFGED